MQKTNKIDHESRNWIALTALCIGVFMSLLDVTIVNVALPTIQKDLSESFSNLQWIINAYTISYAVFLLLASKLADLFGRKKVFLIELAVFTLGSLASGLAQNGMQLNIFRAIQGIGGAGMMSISMAIVAATFSGKERGIAFGIWSSVIGFATAIGPLLGGFLVQMISWRAIFMINIPVGIIALFLSVYYIEESYGSEKGRIDWLGMLISVAMIFFLIIGLIQKELHTSWSWTNIHIAGPLVLGFLFLLIFIYLENFLKSPMIDLSIFKSWSFDGAVIAAFCLGASLYAFFTYLTVWMQNYIGYSAIQTGIRQLAISLFSLVLGPIIGILSNRLSKKWMITVGLLLIAGGFLVIDQTVSTTVVYADFVWGFVLMGIGNAVINPPLSSVAMDSVELKHIGMASGAINVFRQLGVSFGIVSLGLKLTDGYNPAVTNNFAKLALQKNTKSELIRALHSAGPISGKTVIKAAKNYTLKYPDGNHLFHQMSQAIYLAFNTGYKSVLSLAIGFAVIGSLGAFLLIRKK